MKRKLLITGALHSSVIQSFTDNNQFDLIYRPDCSREELFKHLRDTHILVSRSETDVDKEVIEAAPLLQLIMRSAVGVGNIDIEHATKRGILVINCPGMNTNSAAELTLGLLLNLFRHIGPAHHTLSSGGWDRHRFHGKELREKKIGIIGLGNVGHRVAKFALGFDMEVFAYDPYISPEVFQKNRVKRIGKLDDLLSMVDILTVHVPLNSETKGMINRKQLAKMPKGSYVLNAARGGVIDEEALLEALNSGHIAGAGIDTFLGEPTPMRELVSHPHVICTPHIGATTEEAQQRIGAATYEQVVKFASGSVVDYPVNLPQIGVIDDPVVKSYSLLAEKLGSMLAQILNFNPSSFHISYRGDISEKDHALIRLGFIRGYIDHLVEGYVSFVNADQHFKKFGIELTESNDPDFESYRSAIKVTIKGRDDAVMTLGGIVFDDKYLRISLLNEYYFEVEPLGYFLIIENEDRPGVIGSVGQFLGQKNININSFNLSRNRKGGAAMAIISLDENMSKADLQAIAEIKHVKSAKIVSL